MRIGIGHDTHRLIPTIRRSSIPIGGISIPCFYQVEAYSDGDVLLHALTDACLGALALGDIGQWFPDSDTKNANRPSIQFVEAAMVELKRLGWKVQNVDCTIHLEDPKLSPHMDDIRKNIATILGTELHCISVKAKTTEGLGPIGERRALAADSVVLLIQAQA